MALVEGELPRLGLRLGDTDWAKVGVVAARKRPTSSARAAAAWKPVNNDRCWWQELADPKGACGGWDGDAWWLRSS